MACAPRAQRRAAADAPRRGNAPCQALFGPSSRDASALPSDPDDAPFLELLNDAIGKTETDLHSRQGLGAKPPDRIAERYWSQFWLALFHDEEPLAPSVVAQRRTAKERMAFETAKYADASNKLDMFHAVSRARPRLVLRRARRAALGLGRRARTMRLQRAARRADAPRAAVSRASGALQGVGHRVHAGGAVSRVRLLPEQG